MGITYLSGMLKPAMPVYLPGEQVTGVVRLQLNSPTSIRNVLVELSGKGDVKWSKGSGETTATFTNNEVYIQKKVIVWRGTGTGGKMHAGVYKFPFSFTLPKNIPSSFEGPFGHVRYTITSRADREWWFDTTHSFAISVCTLYDLNTNPQARTPFSIDKSECSCILCCSPGSIHVTLYSDRSGFVPGETMIVNGEVHNKGSFDVAWTQLEIIQVVVHKAKPSCSGIATQTSNRLVKSVTRGGIVAGRSIAWNNVMLSIPSVVPTDLAYCNIMDVSYLVKFSAKFIVCRAFSKDQPITIGSIPFSAKPGSQPNIKIHPMPTSFKLYGVSDTGVETTASNSGTGAGCSKPFYNIAYNAGTGDGYSKPFDNIAYNAGTGDSYSKPFDNIAYNGLGTCGGLALYVAPSLFKSRKFTPKYVVYASPPSQTLFYQR